MKGPLGLVVATAVLWTAGVAQIALSPRMAVFHAVPDFPLLVLGCVGPYCNRRSATVLGFGSGLLQGVISNANLTLYVASRCIAGFLLGWFNTLDVQVNSALMCISAAAVVLCAQFLLMFLGAHHGPLSPFLAGTLATAV